MAEEGADDFIEDLFASSEAEAAAQAADDPKKKSKKKIKKKTTAGDSARGADEKVVPASRDRGDSELDHLFNEIGLSSLSPSKTTASEAHKGSFDDVDSFLNSLGAADASVKPSSSPKAGEDSSGDFLDWLDAGKPEADSKSGEVDVDGEDEVEVDFYVEKKEDQKEGEGPQGLHGEVLQQPVHEEAEEIMLEDPKLNFEVDADAHGMSLPEETGDVKAFESKVKTRLETLFEIDQKDGSALRSALRGPEVHGFVVSPDERERIWSTLMNVRNYPDWFKVREERLEELFPSVKKSIQKDCENAWKRINGDPSKLDGLVDLVYRFTLRQEAKTYTTLLSNVAVMPYKYVSAVEDVAFLIESLSLAWGGRGGDWSSTDFTGGAAWTRDAVESVASRRHGLLKRLLMYHDPAVAAHIEQHCPAFPSASLFGLFSVLGEMATTALWDVTILLEECPQKVSFFVAVALVILKREEILASKDSPVLAKVIEEAPESVKKWRSVQQLVLDLLQETPSSIQDPLGEDELVLNLASQEDLGMFDFHRSTAKNDELRILQEFRANEKEALSQTEEANANVSIALRKRANDFRHAMQSLSTKPTPIDWEKSFLKRRLVEFVGEPNDALGLKFKRGRHGLEVAEVEEGGIANRTGLVASGDLVMTLNGLLIFGLYPAGAEALIALQRRPFHMIIGTLFPKELESQIKDEDHDEVQVLTCPGMINRLAAFYAKYNPGKEREAERISKIYSNREKVLLEELRTKYGEHVEGDPFAFPLSNFCAEVSAAQVVQQLCSSVEENRKKERSFPSKHKFFLVDCRSPQMIESSGKFPTSYILDPATLSEESTKKNLSEIFVPMRGDMHICILGSGVHVMQADFNPDKASKQAEMDRRAIDTAALYFLQLGFSKVSVVQGGFLQCFIELRKAGLLLEDCLVNMPPKRALLHSYDAFQRYRSSKPGAAAAFMASKAKKVIESSLGRESSLSFTGMEELGVESSIRTKEFVGKASKLLSSVWRKDGSTQANESTKVDEDDDKVAEKTDVEVVQGELGDKTNQDSATSSAPSWASSWSSRFKMPDTATLSSRFKSSVNQAYASAQQTLAVVASEASKASSAASSKGNVKVPFEPDPELLQKIRELKVNDVAELGAIRPLYRAFEAFSVCEQQQQREQEIEKEDDSMMQKGKLLVITPERFLILQPLADHEEEGGEVLSTRPLDHVIRMRFPNEDPSCISLFFKDGEDEISQPYRFEKDAKAFIKALMSACARFNTVKAKAEAQNEEKQEEGELDV